MTALCLSVNSLNWTLVWLAPGGDQNSEFFLLQTFGQMVMIDTNDPLKRLID